MAIVDYAGFVTVCTSVDGFPTRADGWVLKHTDNGRQYHRVSGQWIDMELGLSFAPPTKSGSTLTDVDGTAAIAFGTPFVDSQYIVMLTCLDPGGTQTAVAFVETKTKDGFTVQAKNKNGNPAGMATVTWLATRIYNT